ncbi:CBS domain-containing protein [Magnetospira sp. QH-2]|uniref:CBS domain-containing protein n=1 Tax=Magnetospira sp. (strain QH-2) TaxID=1288970 RepID=UPI0003E80F0B|nr:CBS domain-containing protein [Magnetospira sp. QH-2]CCQ73587.1 Putative signal transduction protein with CBS domains [Magnetospira sp. QH-2]
MNVGDILSSKTKAVITVREEDTLETVATLLASNRIGAVPVRDDSGDLVGIISERDIVRALSQDGAHAHSARVSGYMSTNLVTCKPGDSCKAIMESMTGRRIRHLPVLADGNLVGVVSQGDVVKVRLEQSELEKAVLQDIAIARP